MRVLSKNENVNENKASIRCHCNNGALSSTVHPLETQCHITATYSTYTHFTHLQNIFEANQIFS